MEGEFRLLVGGVVGFLLGLVVGGVRVLVVLRWVRVGCVLRLVGVLRVRGGFVGRLLLGLGVGGIALVLSGGGLVLRG